MKKLPILLFTIQCQLILLTGNSSLHAQNIDIHYLGHCSFIIQFDDTLRVLMDYADSYPYSSYSSDYQSPIYDINGGFVPDIVTISHTHTDHYSASRIPDGVSCILMNEDTLVKGALTIKPVRTSESDVATSDNSSFVYYYGDLTICHTGDMTANLLLIDHIEQQQHLDSIFPETIDVLFLTIQGTEGFVEEAEKLIDFLKPRMVIPMHYWTPGYKKDFMAYLESENVTHSKNYKLIETGKADIEVTKKDFIEDSVLIVSLDPSPFDPP